MIDFESLIFNIDIDRRFIPHPGSLLVAEPFLRERYFHHSVICLVEIAFTKKWLRDKQRTGMRDETPVDVYIEN